MSASTIRLSAATVLAAFVLVGAAGCGSVKRAVGAEKVTPDEFRVVTKAPLVIPPEFNVRPPKPGEPRPEELIPSDQAKAAIFGGVDPDTLSAGERAIVERAGAESSDPAIRALVDAETSSTVRKTKSFSDRVFFWRDGASPEDDAESAAARAESVTAATGGEKVVIKRDSRLKLPGL